MRSGLRVRACYQAPLLLCILWLGLLPSCLSHGFDLRFNGNYSSTVYLDESRHNPTQSQTYPWVSRTYGSSPSVWDNEFSIDLEGDSARGEMYFRFPLRLRFSLTSLPGQSNKHTYRLVNTRRWSAMTFRLNAGKFSAEVSQSHLFRPQGLLGNFKAANYSDGFWSDDLGIRISGRTAKGWQYFGNVFQVGTPSGWKNQNRFTHYVESLPEEVARLRTGPNEDGLEVGSFQGAWEARASYAYSGAYGNNLLQAQDSWGIYYGAKTVDNPLLMKNNSDAAGSRVQFFEGMPATLGYTKQALELNWQGNLSTAKIAAAYSISSADWRVNLTQTGGAEQISLGTIGGGAAMLDLEGMKVGPVTIDGSWRAVSPNYQWVMARAPSQIYALIGRGKDQKLRHTYYLEQRSVLNTLSEVSRYLGMQSTDFALKLDGKVLDYPSQLSLRLIKNQWLDSLRRVEYWDEDLDLFGNQDYQQTQAELMISPDAANTLTTRGLLRQYQGIGNNYLAQYKVDWQRNFKRTLSLNTNFELRKRFMANAGNDHGLSYYWKSRLEGDVAPNTRGRFSFVSFHGNYDFMGLTGERGYEQITDSSFSYLQAEAYLERRTRVNLFGNNTDFTLLGQVWTQVSDEERIANGTSLVGAVRLSIPWLGGTLRHDIDLIAARGPDNPQLPTGYVIGGLDNKLTYRFRTETNNTLTLRCTNFPKSSGLMAYTVFSAQYRMNLAGGWFVINYGFWDNPLDNSGRNAPWLAQDRLNTKRHPLTEEAFNYSNFWWVSKHEGNRMINYSNYFLINYGINF